MIEAMSFLKSTSSARTDSSIKLPPARSVAKLWPQSENTVALPHGSQTHIADRCHAYILVLELSDVEGLSRSWRQSTQLKLQLLYQPMRSHLERSKQLEYVLRQLLALPTCLALLTHLFGQAAKGVSDSEIQAQMAKALMKALETNFNGVKDHILPMLSSWASDDGFASIHEDLRIAITTTMCRFRPVQACPDSVQPLYEALRQDNVMTDSEILTSFKQLSVAPSTTCAGMRRRKRRRLGGVPVDDTSADVILRTTRLLTGIESQDLAALVDVAPNVYVTLSERDACDAWQCLESLSSIDLGTTLAVVSRLIEVPELHQSSRPRVLSMVAISACAERSTDSAHMNLRDSKIGQLCLRSLHSSLRELRMAASQCLACFLRTDLTIDLQEGNRKATLEYLRALSDRDVACEQETLVGAWGRVALTCVHSELNLALLRLVDYLGHANPFICGLAFSELEKTADAKHQSVDQMLRPFWSTIAVSVVQDLHTKPQKARQLCDLLGIGVNQFLLMTQQETLPSLVLARKRDVLQKVATARGEGTTVEDLCIQPRTNLAAILALLLAQPGPDTEDAAMACLTEVAPGFQGTDISNLVKFDSTLVACYMLKYIGDQSDNRKSRAYQSFQTFAHVAERRPGQTKAHSKSTRIINEFFDTNVLGIMTYFSEVLDNVTGAFRIQEKLRCVRAIGEMIKINKSQVNTALPQIRAALQSAMEQQELCEAAMTAWLHLFSVLDGDDIAHMIDQSFALILRHWSALSAEVHRTIHDKIEELIKAHNDVIRDNIMTVPSLRDIPLLSKFGGEIERLRSQEPVEGHGAAFARRLRDENKTVVQRALQELVPFLEKSQDFIYDSAVSEQPTVVLIDLLRALLDVTAKYAADDNEAAELCAKALGMIGCLDPNRIEVPRKRRRTLLLSNFDNPDEVVDWAAVLLEDVIVKAYKSVTNARAQGYLAYTIQELLRFCEFNDDTVLRTRSSQVPSLQQKWMAMPEHIRISLTPLVKSRYVMRSNVAPSAPNRQYPGFSARESHHAWLRALVYDLMWRGKGDNAKMVFPLLARVIRGHDLAIASFMLPYGMVNVVLGGTIAEVEGISAEMLAVLGCQPANSAEQDTIKLCSESIFSALDYMSTWLQEKRKALGELRAVAFRTGHSPNDFDEAKDMAQIETVERFLASIPAEVIATRAVLCGSYSRALFHWEQYIRQKRPLIPSARPPKEYSDDQVLYDRLQDIYSQINEPDGLEGISAHLSFLSEDQQAMQHAKAGRLTAAQAWYELQLAADPGDLELEEKLLGCLRDTGRYAPLIRYADSFIVANKEATDAQEIVKRLLPSVVEAHWMKGDLHGMRSRFGSQTQPSSSGFNIGIAQILTELADGKDDAVVDRIKSMRQNISQGMTMASTSSVQASHSDLRDLHVLREVEILRDSGSSTPKDVENTLERRLSIVGSYVSEKQYILGVRRAVMQALPDRFSDEVPGSSWLMTAKFARQSGNTEYAYNAVLRAHDFGNKSAKVEEARLLWRDGHQRQAISALESAISSRVFEDSGSGMGTRLEESGRSSSLSHAQNMLAAKAHLLLAKWLDASGQSQANDMTDKYQFAAKSFQRWEKGHYYLGKHYQKLLEAEIALPKNKQSSRLLSGDLTRLVVENQLRSVAFGYKYWHQTIPKILTLWLDLGTQTLKMAKGEDQAMFDKRVKALHSCNRQLQKYFDRVPAYVFWSAVPQMISRITHHNPEIWKQLCNILTRIATAHPNQALWSLLAVVKSTDTVRVERGTEILNRLRDPKAKSKTEGTNVDLRGMIALGQKLTESLLQACEAPVEPRNSSASLSKNLGFSLKLAPNPLVVPIELTLNASLPSASNTESIRKHKAFVQNKITIQSFDDHVLVLSSLQRPRKITVRGSDGKQYGLLCKPKDDLRKDQRLMEFNGIINRALKRDAESSKRRLYIKTYAVTPLSEESGTIEWIEGIKPIRDILLNLYARKGIRPNYNELRRHLDDASATPENAHLFIEKVLSRFPAVLHEWFTEVYPEPETWFAARLRYARSAAVMSVTGHVLGLGDRHGENILLEESTGGVFHVDFNCLFDKGLTFEKPELVPFRLTHNMVDAMGPYGYEGPFRKSSELTMRLLRQSKDTLMTILETFLYDPTTDFVGKKKKNMPGVPDTPQEILDGVEGKLKGLLRGETVPLSVEGYVDALIREATSPWCLASMYIGWCPFL